jgi:hypothetical protein
MLYSFSASSWIFKFDTTVLDLSLELNLPYFLGLTLDQLSYTS